tara:strand:+ start:259 stop:2280 length:2022 start_codon:yes stop_codon:yes gene_type:complete
MAISKINNIAYASLGKFKGVTKANLSKMLNHVKPVAVSDTIPYAKALYFDATNDYLEASKYSGAENPTGQTVANFNDAWDLTTDTGTTAFSLSVDFRAHADAAGSSATFLDIDVDSTNESSSVGTAYGGWRFHANKVTDTYMQVWMWTYVANSDNGNSNTHNSGSGSTNYMYFNFTSATSNHWSDATKAAISGGWHNLTFTRGTSGNMNDANVACYLNGIENDNFSVYSSNSMTTFPNQKWTDAQGRRILLNHYAMKSSIGQIQIYDKQLSTAEVNELYDGGARAGGSADQAEIMNQNPLAKSTAGNLKGWWYLDVDGAGGNDDSGTTLQDKIGDCDFKTQNSTISDITSVGTPTVALFVPGSAPNTVYNGEAQAFTQAGADGSSTVTWYSDSNRTTQVASGNTYSFTPSSTGSNIVVYTKDVNSSSGLTQTGSMTYDVKTAGHLTHSYDAAAEALDLTSPSFASSDFTSGNFSMTFWQNQTTVNNSWGKIVHMDNSNRIQGHLNTTGFFWYITLGGVNKFIGPIGSAKSPALSTWHQWMFTWDTSAGTFKTYANGSLVDTQTDSYFETSLMAATSDFHISIDDRWGKVTGIGLYNDVLTDAEANAICDDGVWSSSKDLEALSGSSSHLLAYYKIGNDTYNNNGSDHLNCEISSSNDIPVANSNATSKSTDRP